MSEGLDLRAAIQQTQEVQRRLSRQLSQSLAEPRAARTSLAILSNKFPRPWSGCTPAKGSANPATSIGAKVVLFGITPQPVIPPR